MSHRPRTRPMHGLHHVLLVIFMIDPSSARGVPDLGGNPTHSGWDEFARISRAAQETRAEPVEDVEVGPALAESGVQRGSMLRVRLTSGRMLEGPFERSEESRLVFADTRRTVVPVAEIDSLWHEGRSKTALKAGITGAIIGATVFGLLLARTTDDPNDEWGAGEIVFTVLSAAVLGGCFGTFLGLIASSGGPQWTLLYAREPASRLSWSLPAQLAP